MTLNSSGRSGALPQAPVAAPEKPLYCRETSPWLQVFLERRGLILAGMDAVASFLAFVSAYYLRFRWGPAAELFPFPPDSLPPLEPYLNMAVLASGLWVFLLSRELSYKKGLHFSRPLNYHARAVFTTGFYAMMFMVLVSFSFRYFLLSRLVYVIWFGLAFCLLLFARFCFDILDRHLEAQKIIVNRILLMGRSQTGDRLVQGLMELNPCTSIIGTLTFGSETNGNAAPEQDVPVLGTGDDLAQVYSDSPFDQLIVAGHNDHSSDDNGTWRNTLISAINFCEAREIPVYMVPDMLDIAVRRQDVGSLGGTPLIVLRDASLHPVYAGAKRIMDVLFSLAVLILGAPVWAIIAVLIKITSPGRVLYAQRRVGLHGKPFDMYKFRSMVPGADERLKELVNFEALDEPVFNVRRDPRVTGIGKILRRTSLDEIPQFINVLLGSMSIVGPRPERVELVERYNPCQMRRLKAKPGITGYQQVMSRGDPSLARRIEYDLYYLKHQSFFLDLFIMLKTVLVVVRGDGTK